MIAWQALINPKGKKINTQQQQRRLELTVCTRLKREDIGNQAWDWDSLRQKQVLDGENILKSPEKFVSNQSVSRTAFACFILVEDSISTIPGLDEGWK